MAAASAAAVAMGIAALLDGAVPAARTPPAAAAVHRIQYHGPDTFEPRGYRRFVARFVWTAPAGEVAVWMSDGGTDWARLGNQQAAPGTNEISLLIPDWYCRLPEARPRLRIGTPDRRYGFETEVNVMQGGE